MDVLQDIAILGNWKILEELYVKFIIDPTEIRK